MAEQPPDEEQREREEGRPDPEELLRRYGLRDRDLEAPPPVTRTRHRRDGRTAASSRGYAQRRGHLRVYLASASRLGQDLYHAQRGASSRGPGYRRVVGYVETHGRPQTEAQIGDLEIIPRKKVDVPRRDARGDGYRGHYRPASQGGADRRTGPYQRARLQASRNATRTCRRSSTPASMW